MAKKRSSFTKSLFDRELPSTWKLVAAGYVLSGTQYGLSEPGASEGNTPIVGMKDIVDGYVSLSDLTTIDADAAALAKFELRRGDILLNRTNSPDLVGKVGIVREDSNAVFASYLVRLNANRSRIDPEFLNFWLNSPIAQQALKRLSTRGVSQANINPTEFQKHCPVPLPPRPEQGRIVEILNMWSEAVEVISSVVEVRERQHLALTHQLVFGEKRLKKCGQNRGTKKHQWFELPSEWHVAPIGKLANEISERNSEQNVTEVLSCSKYDGFVRSLEYFKKQVFSGDLTGYKVIRRDDFGFPSNHVEEGSIGLQNVVDIGLVSPIYTIFRFDPSKIDNGYAISVLKTSLYRHIFEVSTSASVDRRGSLRWKEFAKIEFPVPSLAEQRAITAVLVESQGLIDRLKKEQDVLIRQKRGLMQKLLTGEWRVRSDLKEASDIEKEAAE